MAAEPLLVRYKGRCRSPPAAATRIHSSPHICVEGRVDGGVSDTDVKDVLGLMEQTYGGEVAFLSAEVVRVARLAQLRSL